MSQCRPRRAARSTPATSLHSWLRLTAGPLRAALIGPGPLHAALCRDPAQSAHKATLPCAQPRLDVMARRRRPPHRRVRRPRRCCAPPPRCCCASRAARQPARAPGCAGTRPAPCQLGRVTSEPVCAFDMHDLAAAGAPGCCRRTWLLQAHLAAAAACMQLHRKLQRAGTPCSTPSAVGRAYVVSVEQEQEYRLLEPPGAPPVQPRRRSPLSGRARAPARRPGGARCGRPAPGV